MFNIFIKFSIRLFKVFSYFIGAIAVLILIGNLFNLTNPIMDFFNQKLGYKADAINSEREVSAPKKILSECINPQETLIVNLKECWKEKDKLGVVTLLSQPIRPDKELTKWLRSQVEENNSFSQDDEVHFKVLEKIIPSELWAGAEVRREDRAYLIGLIKTNPRWRNSALGLLGQYRDDQDIQIFINFIRKNDADYNVIMSLLVLTTNCSAQAKDALNGTLNLPHVKRILLNNKYVKDEIEKSCPA